MLLLEQAASFPAVAVLGAVEREHAAGSHQSAEVGLKVDQVHQVLAVYIRLTSVGSRPRPCGEEGHGRVETSPYRRAAHCSIRILIIVKPIPCTN